MLLVSAENALSLTHVEVSSEKKKAIACIAVTFVSLAVRFIVRLELIFIQLFSDRLGILHRPPGIRGPLFGNLRISVTTFFQLQLQKFSQLHSCRLTTPLLIERQPRDMF